MSKFGAQRESVVGGQVDSDICELEKRRVFHWLRCLSWRVPGCDVIIVGTKCDELPDTVMLTIAERLEKAVRKWLKGWADVGRTVNIEPGVSLTSCKRGEVWADIAAWFARETRWRCDQGIGLKGASTRSLLNRITYKVNGVYRGLAMAIPRGWFIALSVLEVLGTSR